MAGGLIALLDDVAALAKLAAASIDDVGAAAGRATTKAAGVLIDDTAVTPQYIQGVAAERELPIIRQIAKGSFRNKLIFILPAVLLLSQFLPWIVEPILMLGGAYLCYEAVHKIWGALSGDGHHGEHEAVESEEELIAGAIRTDLILSAEIMVIALKEVADEAFVSRAAILAVVAVMITVIVYGIVAIIVKADDVGLRMAQSDSPSTVATGKRLVAAMPKVLTFISVLGTAAMLWVGGHIELVGLNELGVSGPYDLVHGWEESIEEAVSGVAGGALAWLTNTAASAVLGLLVGAPLVAAQLWWSSRTGEPAHH
ncbi:DUF808 domain-containing protein [Euzebya tangerina]|uniref:DUF808 domain-containing protein n=1 Tax=Euzebya tangerina TaxID=591198 RepID=UPI000E31DED1|nr:DUF808 domain-containing protein [Euzebya tangerina]